ncbi:acyl-CoA dehydrogenase family protein [Geothrix sp. PMB-07]|uniref:acyl-CoA dehydrogenase family protein n=1 Tax=Geothrix sp. PMB-07 TaxID=3068640 RepID=UPI002741EC32|nr:acyl-CoA dehydrogenase family protein [Geothrix sp. PMB-07]WLT30024.1 acyl-CoA dehydrogenase family protein [Geothrix sp. PMB-07]
MFPQFTEDQSAVREAARDFALAEIEPGAAARDASGEFPSEIMKELGEMGFLGMTVPESYGGAGVDFLSYILALEQIAYADASVAVTMSVNNSVACAPILAFGTEGQKQKYLKPLASGEVLGGFMLTEPDAGSDAAALKTRATKVEGGWRLNGAKAWITNGGVGRYFVTMARTDPDKGKKGISAFILDAQQPGVVVGRAEEKMGLRSSKTVMVALEDAFVPEDALLGKLGDGLKVAFGGLDGGRIGIAAQALGIAQRAMDESVAYAKARSSFGKPIGEHQMIQTYLAEMEARLQASRLLVYRAAALRQAGRTCTVEAATAKLFTTESAVWLCDRAVQIHGGYGYSREYLVERLYRDVRVTTIYEGTSEIQRMVIARELLK